MRIYAVADIHGRPARLSIIRENILSIKPDVLVVAGDITNFIHPAPTIAQLNEMPVPVLVVRGNSDRKWIEKLFEKNPNISSLHLKKFSLKGIGFVGVSGTVPIPFRSRICFREKDMTRKIIPLINKDAVVVAHPPPFGTLDQVLGKYHAGCKGLRNIITKKQPKLFICGHIHENSGTAFIDKTLVVNCSVGETGAGALIELDGISAPKVTMLRNTKGSTLHS
jgi:hypothetical protein